MAMKPNRKRKQINGDHDKASRTNKRAPVVRPYLPIEIIMNILTKLPAKSILRCKLVCKEWHDIVTDQRFAEAYDQEPHITIARTCKTRSFLNSVTLTIDSFHGVKKQIRQSFRSLIGVSDFEALKSCTEFSHFEANFEVVNSCRGFLLVIGKGLIHWSYFCCWAMRIYNPLTNEHIIQSIQGPRYPGDEKLVSGLGYSPSTKQYKVVTFFRQCGSYEIQVQTIGTNTWRTIQGCVNILNKIRPEKNNALALNGSLHWLATGDQIARFDVDMEEFSLIASPCLEEPEKYVISIGMFHGFLCVNIIDLGNYRHGVESWVMKEHGKTESWTQICVIKNIEFELRQHTHQELSNYRISESQHQELSNYRISESGDEGKVLVLTPAGTVFSYDLVQRDLQVQDSKFGKGKFLVSLGFFCLLSTGTND